MEGLTTCYGYAQGSVGTTAAKRSGVRCWTLNFSVDLEHIAIWVSKEQRAVAERMVGWPGDDVHTSFCQDGCTTCNLARGDAERKLQGKCPYRKRRVVEPPAVFSESEQVRANAKLDPMRAELSMERKSEGSAVELPHGTHLTREDDRVIDAANGEFWIHARARCR